ncbi:MAG: cation diffusion facilitator family transporter [Parcubacteria group bacterium]|jgi:cobalt-zinc-cadmium efflux system protein
MADQNHSHSEIEKGEATKNLAFAIGLNIIIVAFEIIFGLLSRSMALISEAIHNFTDVGSMGLSFWGEKLADRPQTNSKTFGYKRAEVIIAFTNGGILLAVTIFIIIEAVGRLLHPETVAGFQMLIAAVVALVGNGIATYILEKDSHKNLNLKSAWLHSFQDAIFSLGVLAAALIIYFTGWNWVDPALSLIISVFLLKEIYSLVMESVEMLLDSVPSDVDFLEVQKSLLAEEGIQEVHDLHIWQTNTDNRFLSAHLMTGQSDDSQRINMIVSIQKMLREKYRINHATLQAVSQQEAQRLDLKCEHCN